MTIDIIGAGGHAHVLGEILVQNDVMPKFHPTDDTLPAEGDLVLGVGNQPTIGESDLSRRKAIFEKYHDRFVTITDMTALVLGTLGVGNQILTRAVVGPGTTIDDNVLVNTGAIVEHDCVIKSHVHIAPGAILCGGVYVGDLTHIGAGAIVLNGVRIGESCVVGAGAVVRHDMPDGTTILSNGRTFP